MTDQRIAEITARCEAWKKQEAWHLECGLCNGNELAVKDIPYLLSQLAEYDEIAAEYGIDGKTMLTLAKSQIKTAKSNVELQEQLVDSQRRAQTARNELCLKCGRYREAHNGACDGCFYNGQIGNCGLECPAFLLDKCPIADEVKEAAAHERD